MDIKKKLLEKGFFISRNINEENLNKVGGVFEDFLSFLENKNIKIINNDILSEFLNNRNSEKTHSINTKKKHEKIMFTKNTKNTLSNKIKSKNKSNNKTIFSFINKKLANNRESISTKNNPHYSETEFFSNNSETDNNTVQEVASNSKESTVLILEKSNREIGEEVELSVTPIKVLYKDKKEISIYSWSNFYIKRLQHLRSLLKKHNLDSFVQSLKHLDNYSKNDKIAISGLIYDKKPSKNGYIYVLEDINKKIKVFVNKDVQYFEDIPRDSVVSFVGTFDRDRNIFYAEEVIFPDIPIKQVKKLDIKEDIWVAFTGDFQIGNKAFLRKEFERFILWLQGKYGSEKQKNLAKNVGYVVITGDLIDGVGVYPYQENELEIKTAEEQYEAVENYLLNIPPEKKIIIIPGNHDIPRLAEPQPPIPKEYVHNTFDLDNFYYFSNPAYFKIHNDYSILLYHGYSFDWFVSHIPYIRNNGGYDNPGNIMKFILMLRHLSPDHNSVPYSPFYDYDPLIIDPVPDAFVTGHIHRTYYGVYKGVEMINASCFQGITPYQMETGHIPDPAKVILRNLRTGEVKILDFSSKSI